MIFLFFNVPLKMRMESEFTFLFVIIPGFFSSGKDINVCLELN